ncbi:MAG: hypothetical protein Q3983_07680 [Capnocytophaga sp.]|nr:hypothetical protein [Capnocytophaga sp.]
MGTFIQIVILAYLLYYSGNILYDIFIRKPKKPIDEQDKEEFSLGEIVKPKVVNVELDDVEQMNTNSTMEIEEEELFGNSSGENDTNLDALKEKFEQEEQLTTNAKNTSIPTSSKIKMNEDEVKEKNKQKIQEMMRQAQTQVQVVGMIDDEKIYAIVK